MPLHDFQPGDDLEVTGVTGDDPKPELQGGRGDQKILEGDGDTLGSLVAFDAASLLPAFFHSGTPDAVREFDDRHHGDTDLDFAVTRFQLFQDLPNGVAAPRGLTPRRQVPRLAATHDLLHVGGEVRIEHRRLARFLLVGLG